jgi:rod shape-determining protein MreD
VYAAKVVAALLLAVLIQIGIPTLTGSKRFDYVDLPLIVTVYFSLRRSQLLGMVSGMTSGLAQDALSHSFMGVGGLTKTIIGYLVATISIRFELDNFLMRLLTVTIASACNALLFIGINKIVAVPQYVELTGRQMWRTVGIETVANLGVALFIFVILDRMVGRADSGKVETVRAKYYR